MEPLQPKTDCPHFQNHVCTWLSGECGRAIYTSGPRCQIDCRGERPKSLALKVLPQEHNVDFVTRTFTKNDTAIMVQIPPTWNAIETMLIQCGVMDSEHVQAVYLTGSAIYKADPKDIDIVIHVADLKGWLAEGIELPKQISGKTIDWWVHTKRSPFYPMLDPVQKVLHLPLFGKPMIAAAGIRPVPADGKAWAPDQRAVLHRIAANAIAAVPVQQPVPVQTKGKGCNTCTRAKRQEGRK